MWICNKKIDGAYFRAIIASMSTQLGTTIKDREQQQAGVANRLWKAREFLHLTQQEFAGQVAITRDRLASYEDGRVPIRCDIALRACRQFFISEFWLAYGAADEQDLKSKKIVDVSDLRARLTMALAVEPIGLSCPPDVSFVDGFDPYLRQQYLVLACLQMGFPRINPLPSDGPEYFSNALHCAIEFWKTGLSPTQWQSFFYALVVGGQSLHRQVRDEASPLAVDVPSMVAAHFIPLANPRGGASKAAAPTASVAGTGKHSKN
ncbi:MAG: helix-turn-helix transcriptional regulator [Verrucomicrobiota bacterium]|jgi:DNA-binding XRE family transcriptional regulator